MRRFSFVLSLVALGGCAEHLPEVVPLSPAAEQVEVVNDPPDHEIYTPIGALSARVAGNDAQTATREAKNELRNQAAQKGGTLVSIDEVQTNNSLTSRGRTVVSMTGTVYKAK